MMRRRTFIGLGVAAAAGLGAGYWFWDRFFGGRPRDLPGREETLESMAAMVEPVLSLHSAETASLSLEPYRSLFRWRFENLPRERDVQKGFASLLDELAREQTRINFAECEAATRRKVLESALDSPNGREAGSLLTGLIVQLFARTDSYRLLGYESPPGTPRGLESYTQPPGV